MVTYSYGSFTSFLTIVTNSNLNTAPNVLPISYSVKYFYALNGSVHKSRGQFRGGWGLMSSTQVSTYGGGGVTTVTM